MDAVQLRMRWSQPDRKELREALLAGALIDEAVRDWRGVDLRGAHLHRGLGACCQLDFAQLDGAHIERLVLAGASLSFVSAVESTWTDVSLVDANIACSNFAGASLIEAKLDRASLVGATFAGADLRAASLHGVNLRGCDLESALLSGAVLSRDPRRASLLRRHCARTGCATFADIMENGGYMGLLRLSERSAARAVEGVAWGAPLLDVEIRAALGQPSQFQLVAAAVAVLGADRIRRIDAVVAALWRVLAGSWASPQLAVACALLDAEFVPRARALLRVSSDAKTIEALEAFTDGRREGWGARFAMKWRANVEKWASSAARAKWVNRGS